MAKLYKCAYCSNMSAETPCPNCGNMIMLNSGEKVLDPEKLIKTTTCYLEGTREESNAYLMYQERLKLINERLDEVRELEQDTGGVHSPA